jgi:hypothetical protein
MKRRVVVCIKIALLPILLVGALCLAFFSACLYALGDGIDGLD